MKEERRATATSAAFSSDDEGSPERRRKGGNNNDDDSWESSSDDSSFSDGSEGRDEFVGSDMNTGSAGMQASATTGMQAVCLTDPEYDASASSAGEMSEAAVFGTGAGYGGALPPHRRQRIRPGFPGRQTPRRSVHMWLLCWRSQKWIRDIPAPFEGWRRHRRNRSSSSLA